MHIEKMIDEISDTCYNADIKNHNYEVNKKISSLPSKSQIIDDVAEISELTGRIFAHNCLSNNPNLRSTNHIRTIHGSLAIEQNTLSLEQVTVVLNGKYVLALPKISPRSRMLMIFTSD